MDSQAAYRDFLEYVVGTLVSHPDDVAIEHALDGDRHVFRLTVNEDDLGVLIGKNGYTVSSIRSLLNAAAARQGEKVVLKVDED